MTEVKDKIVTVESLSVLHKHNQNTYMTAVDPSGSGEMTFDGDINIDGHIITGGDISVGGDISADGNINADGNIGVGGDINVGRNISVTGNVTGDLKVSGNVVIENHSEGIYGLKHPTTEEWLSMLYMNPIRGTVVGFGGYKNNDADTYICGRDVEHHIASSNVNYRPYYRAGDVINIRVRTSGYVTQMGKNVVFTIPLTKPIIGSVNINILTDDGFILRQNGKYTHGSDGSTLPKATYAQPIAYTFDDNLNSGIIVTAEFENTTNVINNDSIGIYLDAKIRLTAKN